MSIARATTTEYDVLMKAIVIGDSGVGKSSLLHRYMNDDWSPSYIATIGVDFKIDTFETLGKVVKLQLWDTAGHERFKAIASAYYRGAHCILLCYDITSRESFEHVADWMKEVQKYGRDDVPMALVACKGDLDDRREVTEEEGIDFAASLGFKHYTVSAKDARGGVDHAVHTAVKDALERRLETMPMEADVRKTRLRSSERPRSSEHKTCLQRFRVLLGI